MPQASTALTEEWDGPDDSKAMLHLYEAGFMLTRKWTWKHKDPTYIPTAKDRSAAQFLIEEWDFDGIEK